MKKILSILAIILILASLVGCAETTTFNPASGAEDIASDMGNEVLEMQEMMGGLMPFQTESSSEASTSESTSK